MPSAAQAKCTVDVSGLFSNSPQICSTGLRSGLWGTNPSFSMFQQIPSIAGSSGNTPFYRYCNGQFNKNNWNLLNLSASGTYVGERQIFSTRQAVSHSPDKRHMWQAVICISKTFLLGVNLECASLHLAVDSTSSQNALLWQTVQVMGTMVGFVMPFSWLPLQHGVENAALSLVESAGSLPCPLDLYLTWVCSCISSNRVQALVWMHKTKSPQQIYKSSSLSAIFIRIY